MGRQKMPEMPSETAESETLPVFGSEQEAENAPGGLPAKYVVQAGGVPSAPSPVPSALPRPKHNPALEDEITRTERRLAELRSQAAGTPVEAAKPKRYRVEGLQPGGRQYVDQQGRTSRLVPGKILDARYFNIEFIRKQGFNLVEVGEEERQVGRIIG